ncbi:hypothetical protein NKJ46_11660 [Mesorhizobium sp. M0166]|uniref:hypothetical protein n=1 Tax=unclassified Mesorhizobium TaxID=325217 RepID=UPI00333C08B9
MTLQPKSATAPLTGLAGLLGLALAVAMPVDRSWPAHLQAMTVIAATAAAMIAVDTAYFQTFRRRSTGLQAKPMRALEAERVVRKLIGFFVTLTTIAAVYWIVPEYRREFYAPTGQRSTTPCRRCSSPRRFMLLMSTAGRPIRKIHMPKSVHSFLAAPCRSEPSRYASMCGAGSSKASSCR